jgi:[histone H3]-trimethyl-L-lysine4 demethylase
MSPSCGSQPKGNLHIPSASKLSRLSATVTNADDTSPPSSPLTATSSPLSEPPDESDHPDANGKRREGSRHKVNGASHEHAPR